jgi:hypothetical protein
MWVLYILIITASGSATSQVIYFPNQIACTTARQSMMQQLPSTQEQSYQLQCLQAGNSN